MSDVQPTNLILICSDEHNREITGCYGNDIVRTPNLDALAARGTRFDNAYTNCPICVPARASLATGRYAHQIRKWDNGHPYFGEPRSFGHRLIEHQRQVAAIGKLHYRSTRDPNGWSEEIGTLHVIEEIGDIAGCIRKDMLPRRTAHNLARQAGRGDSSYQRYDNSSADNAVKWLERAASQPSEQPWMLYVGFVMPHFPLVARPEFFDLYPPESLPWPRAYARSERPDHPVLRELARIQCYDDYFDEQTVRIARAAYFGMVTHLDKCVGRVLETLERTGLASTTRVIYTSDHGDNLGNRGMWGKSNMFEESAAVPMLMAGPQVPAGGRVEAPVSLVDAYPTILESVGIELDQSERETLPGHSLLRIANGEIPQRTVLSEYHAVGAMTGMFMIRDGHYKYVHYVGQRPQLFDLQNDPHEQQDLANVPEHAGTLARCEAKLRDVCDPDAVNAQAFADQAALLEEHGGREAVLARGDFGYTPAPGEQTHFS
ncbi:MAG: sulfatase-like hydrolase/transferase [Gammaproteobacteria bacterium]|nr:sulfatase-like hydrolase/transferase [Gammaproteobacteria bacterium]